MVAVDLSVDALVEDYPAVALAVAADVTQGVEVEEAFARADAALGAVDEPLTCARWLRELQPLTGDFGEPEDVAAAGA